MKRSEGRGGMLHTLSSNDLDSTFLELVHFKKRTKGLSRWVAFQQGCHGCLVSDLQHSVASVSGSTCKTSNRHFGTKSDFKAVKGI